jgi:hypothetical protein
MPPIPPSRDPQRSPNVQSPLSSAFHSGAVERLSLRLVRSEGGTRYALRWLTGGEFAYYQRTGHLADWARPPAPDLVLVELAEAQAC